MTNKDIQDFSNRDGNGYGDPNARDNDDRKLLVLLAQEQSKIGTKLNQLTFALVVVGLLNVDPLVFQVWGNIIEKHIMNIAKFGLLCGFIGTVLLGLSTQFGLGAGWGGKLIWEKKHYWRLINALGWFLLALGFLMQLGLPS